MFKSNSKIVYNLIKFIKIVDTNESKNIDPESIIFSGFDFVEGISGSLFDNYSINYGYREYHSANKFKEFISSNKEIVDLFCSKKDKKFGYSNFLLNLTGNKPEFGVLEITFIVDFKNFDTCKCSQLLAKLNKISGVDYGYIKGLSKGQYLLSEEKVTTSLFGLSISAKTKKSESTWQQHIYGVKMGYLKDIYSVNFLNKSQMKNPFIKSFHQESVGDFKKISNNLHFWELNKKQIEKVKKAMKDSPYLMGSDKGYVNFLASSQANQIKLKTHIELDIK